MTKTLPAIQADAPPVVRDYRLIALIIASALFMENLDATVLTTALPTLARDFGVTPPAVSVTVTAYLLALAVFVPVSGYMADRFGARNVFRSAILIFMAGSLVCALAPSLLTIAVARFVQGMGGAMMVPVGRLVLLRSVEKNEFVASQAWLLMPGLLGTILGPPVGGFIVTFLDWRWIFWINLPIGAVGIYLIGRFIPELRSSTSRRFDGTGFVVSGLALSALMFGFELAGPAHEPHLGWPLILLGAVMVVVYLWHSSRSSDPILDLSLLRIPTFRLAMIGGSLTRITQGAQPYLLSLMMQLGFGFTAFQSGAITLATALGTFAMKSQVVRILRHLGFRNGLVLMGLLGGCTYAACGFFQPGWPVSAMFCVLVLAGFFMSFQFTAYNTIAYDEIPADRMSSATSFYSTFQQLTLSLGICTAATVLQLMAAREGSEDPDFTDFSLAFWVVTGISLCSFFANIRFHPQAGAELARRSANASSTPAG
ncbi:MFS transporter [Sphingobium boeckii]|uniref:EmrB/QacA subfamily drug resistance transporter n=1 Tax=Sphingobium boeckii TaxID=1082345 RepID=A0A7W9AL89_9SPHN|nr:EmrB/QacA subfamily drug resistance transporter [Sphingobium boeckii]